MIPVQNVYYMLAYAFKVLNEDGYKEVAAEQFHNVAELCSAILCKGVSLQLKRGLGREYISETETLSGIRGKIDITESIKTQTMLRKQLVCTYDEFSVNTYMNRIIKTTMLKLMHADIDKARKKEIRRLLAFFNEVDELEVHSINWNQQYSKNNQTYRMLISICYLVLKGLLQTTMDGKVKLMQFVDEMEFDRLGVFTYSPEEDTPAAVMPDQIDEEAKKERQAELMELQQDIVFENARNMTGREVLVMVEGKVADENAYVGRTYRDAPNVDGLIFINTDEELLSGDFARVKVTGALDYDLIGELL